MRNYNYINRYDEMLTPEIFQLVNEIHEYKGKQELYNEKKADILDKLLEIAIIQSTDASNRIEGIYTSSERLNKIVSEKTTPRNRNEREIAGYRDVLKLIHENYENIPLKSTFILQLHKNLYKYENSGIGGTYKEFDNVIEEQDNKGNKKVRFVPVSAVETPGSVSKICENYKETIESDRYDALIIIPMFILDFLCIHPFRDGNGRMSRLLTLMLLYQNGYDVGKYISLEKIIEKNKDGYYSTLQDSSEKWCDEKNDYIPFIKYTLEIILMAYKELENRMDELDLETMSKPEKVKEVIKTRFGEFSKSDIIKLCPNISEVTIQRTLKDMLDKKEIIKINGGRYTKYKLFEEK